MQKHDFEILLKCLSLQNGTIVVPNNPIDEISFDEEHSKNLLNIEEQNQCLKLEDDYAVLRQQLSALASHDDSLELLLSQYEDAINNMNALTMTATFREGLLKGFRLAQFFIQGTYQTDAKR